MYTWTDSSPVAAKHNNYNSQVFSKDVQVSLVAFVYPHSELPSGDVVWVFGINLQFNIATKYSGMQNICSLRIPNLSMFLHFEFFRCFFYRFLVKKRF